MYEELCLNTSVLGQLDGQAETCHQEVTGRAQLDSYEVSSLVVTFDLGVLSLPPHGVRARGEFFPDNHGWLHGIKLDDSY